MATKISKFDAYQAAKQAGVVFGKDVHEQRLGAMNELAELAKNAGYKKPTSASGSTARYFYEHLEKTRRKHGWR